MARQRDEAASDRVPQNEAAPDVQRELRESEQRYRTLIETSPNGIIVHRADRFLYANPAALALYGAHSLEQLQQHRVLELIHPADREGIADRMRQVQNGGMTPRREVRVVRLDGREVFVEASAGPVDFQGEPAIQAVLRDVTDRQQAAQALRQSEERYRLLFETMLQGVVHQDADGTIISMNPAAERILGKTPEQFVGSSSVQEEWHTLRDDGSAFPGIEHPAMVALRTGQPQRDVVMGVYNPREECYRWIRISAVPLLRPGDAEPYQVYTLFHDITEQRQEDEARRQAEAAVRNALEAERRARAEAEAANRVKDDFLSTVSHELRTPLSAIIGWAMLLEKETLTPAEQARARAAIARNARRQAQLVNDLLDVSRIMAGKLRLEGTHLELETVVRAAVDAVTPMADARSIHISLALDSGAPVYGDATRLQQIAWNLLSNAIKFTPEGGNIHVSVERSGGEVELRVRDTGVGIEPAFLPYVFERFRQADNTTTRSFGGLGLGLAIVRQLAELHGGTVAAESEGIGRGSTFIVTLPVAPDVTGRAERVHATAAEEGDAELPRLNGMRILVVDDEGDAREVVAAALMRYGAAVTTAPSAAEALQRVRETAPDLIVADIGMPGEDGYALIRKLRELDEGRYASVPSIALTAYARSEDAERAREAGFDLHLPKPAEPSALAHAIASLMGRADRPGPINR